MRKNLFYNVVRVLLGLLLAFSGFNKLIGFLENPPLPEAATALISALFNSGYMMTVVGIFEIVIGIMMVFNRFVPLAAVLLVPLSINFILFHLFLDLRGIIPAVVISIANLYIVMVNWDLYKPLLKMKD